MHTFPHIRTPLLGLALLGLIGLVTPAWGQIEAGEHIRIQLDTPWDYKGTACPGEVEWRYELIHPGATYIALHFTDFDLAPGDYLMVSDPEGEQTYTMEGRGKMDAGTFWAQHIKGDIVILELVKMSPEGGRGFRIDEYVAGWLDL
ncbi:MAG: hypothetical protein KAY37_05885 [Phycisphaerae bacterium]|nr:hypothetical protein [Phycisphaerae bacterium]